MTNPIGQILTSPTSILPYLDDVIIHLVRISRKKLIMLSLILLLLTAANEAPILQLKEGHSLTE